MKVSRAFLLSAGLSVIKNLMCLYLNSLGPGRTSGDTIVEMSSSWVDIFESHDRNGPLVWFKVNVAKTARPRNVLEANEIQQKMSDL